MCISKKFPDDTDTAGPRTTLQEIIVLEKHPDLFLSPGKTCDVN